MNERFLIPAAVAAALHAALFFGFNPGEIPVLHREPRTVASTPPQNTVKVEWAANVDQGVSAEPKASAAVAAPEIPEPPPRDFDPVKEITIPREAPRVTTNTSTATIPISRWGPSDGRGGFGPGGSGPVSFVQLDNLPRTRSQLAPEYPYEARRTGQPGEVVVEFVVDEDGRVVDPHVTHSNDPIFDAPTLRAVAKWRFEPGRKNGRVVRFRMAVPVAYAVNP